MAIDLVRRGLVVRIVDRSPHAVDGPRAKGMRDRSPCREECRNGRAPAWRRTASPVKIGLPGSYTHHRYQSPRHNR
ncbi:hypothetical protein QA862_12230 [Streptomyces sp. B21-101]|uniref:hypothetical protein n=1 Tax=unclassified Streptomyces TaxID=2593676 RepID=UPI002E1BFCA8